MQRGFLAFDEKRIRSVSLKYAYQRLGIDSTLQRECEPKNDRLLLNGDQSSCVQEETVSLLERVQAPVQYHPGPTEENLKK